MILVWIPVSILILYVLLNMVYARLWKKGLSVELSFEEKDAAEGDTATLVETVTNDKFLPLPVLKISFKMDRGLIVDEDRNASVSDMTNVVEYFGLSSREQVIRRQPVWLPARYQICPAGSLGRSSPEDVSIRMSFPSGG